MSLIHNRVLEGVQDSMVVLLKVASQFPDATDDNVSQWQNSVIAWWRVPEKRKMMTEAYKKLSKNEVSELNGWLKIRSSSVSETSIKTLVEIEHLIDTDFRILP